MLILADLDIAYCNTAAVAVDAPAILLDAIDTVGVADIVIHVHHHDAVVSIDINLIDIVIRTSETITVDALDEALAIDNNFLFFAVFINIFFYARIGMKKYSELVPLTGPKSGRLTPT